MQPPQTKPFQKIQITFFLTILVMLVFVGAYIYFYISLQNIRQSVIALNEGNSVLEKQEMDSARIKKDLASVNTRNVDLSSHFVDAGNPVPFENTIEGYGKDTNVAVSFSGLSVAKNPNRLDASFSATGSFTNLYRFFAMLEVSPYELSIQSVNLQTAGPQISKSSNAWNASVSLSVYSISGAI